MILLFGFWFVLKVKQRREERHIGQRIYIWNIILIGYVAEKLKHFKLKEKAKELLKQNRFSEDSIKTEIIVDIDKPFPHFWKINVVGFKEGNN